MTAKIELKKIERKIRAIGAMFKCPCCEDTLENSGTDHILETVVMHMQSHAEQSTEDKLH